MTALRIYFDGDRTGPMFRRSVERQGARVRAAARGTAQDAAKEIDERGGADVAAAGKFGPRWMPHTTVTEGGGNIRIDTRVGTGLFWVFQKGMTIYGKPYLWIPQGDDGPYAPAIGIWAKKAVEPKKFHVVEIIREVAGQMRTFYSVRMKS